MLLAVFLALFLPCAGMSAVFVVYMCLLWYSSGLGRVNNGNGSEDRFDPPVKPSKGLTVAELEKLPRVKGKELMMGTDCAVCLDDIGDEEVARMVPGCNHGFHVECADTWLMKQRVCPVCRGKLGPEFFETDKQNSC